MSSELLNKLLTFGVSKKAPKKDLIRIFSTLKSLEERAKLVYDGILKNNLNELTPLMRENISKIMKDEKAHIKIADELIKTISDYDLELDIIEYFIPRSD